MQIRNFQIEVRHSVTGFSPGYNLISRRGKCLNKQNNFVEKLLNMCLDFHVRNFIRVRLKTVGREYKYHKLIKSNAKCFLQTSKKNVPEEDTDKAIHINMT
jgi:hypothetical protein